MSGTSLAMRNNVQALQVYKEPTTLEEMVSLGEIFAKSGFFNDSKDAAKCVVKILAGQELGISPFASMRGIHIIQGQASMGANLQAAVIKRSGKYNFRIKQLDNQKCVLEFFEKGEPIGMSEFSMEDARKAGATDGANKHSWTKYPRNMLFARAISNGSRWYCADVFGGPVYDPDELGAGFDTGTGEYIPTAQTEQVLSEGGQVIDLPTSQNLKPIKPREEMTPLERNRNDIWEHVGAIANLDPNWANLTKEQRGAEILGIIRDTALERGWEEKTINSLADLTEAHQLEIVGWFEGKVNELQEKVLDEQAVDDPVI